MNKIDESLYSRQLYVLGKHAMEKMSKSSILISGLSGVGIEIAKCVILGGVSNVTLHDTTNLTHEDLCTNYYITDSDIGKKKTIVSEKLKELNPYVNVCSSNTEHLESEIAKHNVVVICDDINLDYLIEINDLCRKYASKFICCSTFGLMGQIFCDFGPNFIVHDHNGEEPKSGLIVDIKDGKQNMSILTTSDQHGLETGDLITLSGSFLDKPMNVLVNSVVNKNKIEININLPSGVPSGLHFEQIKQSITMKFETLNDQENEPTIVDFDIFNSYKSKIMHAVYTLLDAFKLSSNDMPEVWSKNALSFSEFVRATHRTLLKDIKFEKGSKELLFLQQLCCTLDSKLVATEAVIGSIVAQEVMKACTGKFTPIHQWFYFESLDSLPLDPHKLNHTSFGITNKYSRYNNQINIFGREVQERIDNSKIFIVGSGAIGCEHLKNFAMMGVGHLVVTDMDNIEKSNLNRQFLFRNSDIGNAKSVTAAREILKMNPHIKVEAHLNRVGAETAHVYNEKFFESLTCVANALDNVQARLYVDSLCVSYQKPLLESGTLGSKGNTQAVIPYVTESYGSTRDPPEQSVPICTLKNFPYAIEHTIQYARDLFEGIFYKAPNNFKNFIKDPVSIMKLSTNELASVVFDIKEIYKYMPKDYKDCINYGYDMFHNLFRNQIHELVTKHPENQINEEGVAFWSGTKKYPLVLSFDNSNPLHTTFVIVTARLWANLFGLSDDKLKDDNFLIEYLGRLNPPQISQNTTDNIHDMDIKQLITLLPNVQDLQNVNVMPIEFEKDDDTNHHIDFVMCVSNLRATNYKIATADKHKTKGIAGKIIPAIATTTSLVSGLVALEFYKIINGHNKIDQYRNYFVNLAIPLFTFSEPGNVTKTKVGKVEFSMWDSFKFNDPTARELINHFKDKYKVSISSITADSYMLTSPFMSPGKLEERMNMKISHILKDITKKDPPSNPFVISVITDDDDDDINLPDCKVYY